MPSPSPDTVGSLGGIRTLALVAGGGRKDEPGGSPLLWRAGAVGAPGRLERGSTVSDFDPLERRVQHSLNTSLVHLHHADTRIHLIDTPGTPDFLGQSLPALEAVETAAGGRPATTGLEMMAERSDELCGGRQRTRIIVVNKIDARASNPPLW